MVKYLLVDNIDGHVIYFCDEAARIARPDAQDKLLFKKIMLGFLSVIAPCSILLVLALL